MTLPIRQLDKVIAFLVNIGKVGLAKKNNNGIKCFECRGYGIFNMNLQIVQHHAK